MLPGRPEIPSGLPAGACFLTRNPAVPEAAAPAHTIYGAKVL